jgi:hypothetical protein
VPGVNLETEDGDKKEQEEDFLTYRMRTLTAEEENLECVVAPVLE